MQIKSVELKNFKCFESVKIKSRKLTLLTGANSSGKSSIIYSLLGAIQSDNFPFEYSLNGKFVRMGDYENVVHGNNVNLPIEITMVLDDDDDVEEKEIHLITRWQNNNQNNLPDLTYLRATNDSYELEIERVDSVKKYSIHFKIAPNGEAGRHLDNEMWAEVYNASVGSRISTFKEKNIDLKESFKIFLEKFVRPTEPIYFTFDSFEELKSLMYQKGNLTLAQAIDSISRLASNYEKKTNFISSFRLYPEQTYYEESQNNLKVGKFGERYQDQLIDWENHNSKEVEILLENMKYLNLIDDIKIQRFGGGRFEVLVKVKQNSVYAALSDVGFGISQFLPIIVADIQLGDSSSLIVAQPEIHLHPSVQAKFGDYLVNQISVNDKSYIIETHSEYIINRIRLAITKGEIDENDVSVFYLENDGVVSKNYEIYLKKNGQIDNAPDGFFETYMMDVMEIALNAE